MTIQLETSDLARLIEGGFGVGEAKGLYQLTMVSSYWSVYNEAQILSILLLLFGLECFHSV